MRQIELELSVSYRTKILMDVDECDIDSINDILKRKHGRIDLNSPKMSSTISSILENTDERYGDDFEYIIKGISEYEA